MILLIDNYDSFVYNLARYFERLGQSTHVVRNDEVNVDQVRLLDPQAIVISPGPRGPIDAGCSLEIVKAFWQTKPMLGICLGHQIIAAAFGARIVCAPHPMHGRTSQINHDSSRLFCGIPDPFSACRYHSLIVDESSLPSCLEVSARTPDGVVMGISHREKPVFGLQFHPESILTDPGYDMLRNFLEFANMRYTDQVPTIDDELLRRDGDQLNLPKQPVTF